MDNIGHLDSNKENFRLSNIGEGSFARFNKSDKKIDGKRTGKAKGPLYGGSSRILKRDHLKSDLGNYKLKFLARNFKNKNSLGGSKFQIMPNRANNKKFNTMKPEIINSNRDFLDQHVHLNDDSGYYSPRISNRSDNKEKLRKKIKENFDKVIFKTTKDRRSHVSKKLEEIQRSLRKKKVILDLKKFNAIKTVKRKGNYEYNGNKKSRNFDDGSSDKKSTVEEMDDNDTLVNFSLKTDEKLELVQYEDSSLTKTQRLTDSMDRTTPGSIKDMEAPAGEKIKIAFFNQENCESKNEEKKAQNLFQELMLSEQDQKVDLDKIEKNQTEIKWKMRAILFDWLSEVCSDYQLCREAYHYSIYYVDKFLENGAPIKKSKFQLLGLTCLMLGCKMEEVIPPSCEELVSFLSGLYTMDEMISCELQIVKVSVTS